MATFISHSPAETDALGETWGRAAERGLVIGLSGDLGAGKTQLVKGLARGLGITARVHSPTFALVNIYAGGRLPLFHLDLYRLETPEQIIAAGLEEYLQPGGRYGDRMGGKMVGTAQSAVHGPTDPGSYARTPSAGCRLTCSARPNDASPMKILALEFSSAATQRRRGPGRRRGPRRPRLRRSRRDGRRSTNALGLVEEALRQAQLDREQIECLAIGLGPGSYTGIRSAIALAQGWQLARDGEAPRHQQRRMPRRPGPGRRHLRARPRS